MGDTKEKIIMTKEELEEIKWKAFAKGFGLCGIIIVAVSIILVYIYPYLNRL